MMLMTDVFVARMVSRGHMASRSLNMFCFVFRSSATDSIMIGALATALAKSFVVLILPTTCFISSESVGFCNKSERLDRMPSIALSSVC